MDIDIERLKTDAAYWDEVAPEVAEFFTTETTRSFSAFWRNVGQWMLATESTEWEFQYGTSVPEFSRAIPRPKAPEVEWEGGVPIAGVECEILGTPEGSWSVGVIDYIDERHCVWHWKLRPNETMHNRVGNMAFRPIRTQEQRQRYELEDLIHSNLGPECNIEAAASAIIAAGWKKDA